MTTRDFVRILVVFACGAGLLLAPAGCRKKPQPPSTPIIMPSEEQPPTATTPDEQPPVAAPTEEQPPEVAPTGETPATATAGNTPAAVPEAGDDQMQIEPFTGVGPVKFKMSKEEVMEVLGQPERMEGGGVALYYLTSQGISLLVDPTRGVRSIDCWSAEYPNPFPGLVTFPGKTEKGIGMGATREQIVAAYGEPGGGPPTAGLETLRYNQLGMSFVLSQGRVVSIKIMAPR